MDWSLLEILLPAMVAGMLVLSTHVMLGRQVLARGIIFIDLALAQIAALGSVLAHTLQDHGHVHGHAHGHLPGMEWLFPLLFALAGAGLIALLERYCKEELEALIGCLYVVSAVVAMLVLAKDPHGGELLKQLLSGQILWTDWPSLVAPAVVTLLVLALVAWRPGWLTGSGFYGLFALVITISVQLVGVYLVFASLILPALAVNRLSGRWATVLGLVTGLLGYGLGLWLSASLDLPSGATIVVTLAVTAFLMRLLSLWRGAQ